MRRSFTFLLATLLMVLFPAVARASFAPADRPTFQCVNQTTGECPGPNYVVFNSFINSPVADAPANGDERAFFEGKEATTSTSVQTGFGDNIPVHDGEQILLRVYIHNGANPNLIGETGATAHNTTVTVQLPSTTGSSNQAIAVITADNAQPRTISDTLDFSAGSPFSLTFDRNSPVNMTTRTDSGQGDFATSQQSGVSFSDDRNMSVNLGDWPGGFNRHGLMTLMATVHMNTVQTIAFACTALDVTSINNNQATFTAHANGQAATANITSYVFTVKDSNGNTVNSLTVNTNAQTAVYNFNQSNPGTYTISAVVSSDKGTTAVSACTRQITVVAPTTATLSASTTPSQALPNTGAGDVLGVFTGVTALGGAGHYIISRRRR